VPNAIRPERLYSVHGDERTFGKLLTTRGWLKAEPLLNGDPDFGLTVVVS
jgi:hypothetical protein